MLHLRNTPGGGTTEPGGSPIKTSPTGVQRRARLLRRKPAWCLALRRLRVRGRIRLIAPVASLLLHRLLHAGDIDDQIELLKDFRCIAAKLRPDRLVGHQLSQIALGDHKIEQF